MSVEDVRTLVRSGHIDPGAPDFTYIPLDVPEGMVRLDFRWEYTNRPATALDIIVFDPRGYGLGNGAGFRGSSGGGYPEFTIAENWATPCYIPGPIEPGIWHVALGPYRILPEGTDWKVTVVLHPGERGELFRSEPAPERLNDTPGWYRGDTHVHSVHSGDGTYRPEDIVEDARDRGLDFIVSTEHHTVSNHLVWGRYAPPDLLVLNGQEVTTRNGHLNSLGVTAGRWIDYRFRPQDDLLRGAVDEVHSDGGLVSANHPFQRCRGCFFEFPYAGMDSIEVWNGPWTPDDEAALRMWDAALSNGPVMTAIGGSDVHGPDANTIGTAQTVVRASGLHREAIVEGIRAGRVYVAESSDLSLELTAAAGSRTAGIGERLDVGPGTRFEVRLRVVGAEGGTVSLHSETGEVWAGPMEGDDAVLEWGALAGEVRYVRAEVRRPDGSMLLLSNPVWIGQPRRLEPVATVGRPDGSALEFALAPGGYGRYSAAFPEDVYLRAGIDDPARGWSYIQPGPADSWAGHREHPFTLSFELARRPAERLVFVAWVLDTPIDRPRFYPASMRVEVNGRPLGTVGLVPGGGDGYHWGDGRIAFGGLYPRSLEFDLPEDVLRRGENQVTVTLREGSWVVWDALGVFRRS